MEKLTEFFCPSCGAEHKTADTPEAGAKCPCGATVTIKFGKRYTEVKASGIKDE